MKYTLLLGLLLTASLVCAADIDHDRVTKYIADGEGILPSEAAKKFELRAIGPNRERRIVSWTSVMAAPTDAQLAAVTDLEVVTAEASKLPIVRVNGKWRLQTPDEVYVGRQAAKPVKLRVAENRVIKHLRQEGYITPTAVKVTIEDLDAMDDAFDQMPEGQAAAKQSKYDRVLSKVIRQGGTELDVAYHAEDDN